MKMLYRIWVYFWALPPTVLGLMLVPGAVIKGGSVRVVDGVFEVHGGVVTGLLKIGLPWTGPAAAMTLGHIILGCDRVCLEKCRTHERVHVRQYERWGPFFIPVYLLVTLISYLHGGDPYQDNFFEREAVNKTSGNLE